MSIRSYQVADTCNELWDYYNQKTDICNDECGTIITNVHFNATKKL